MIVSFFFSFFFYDGNSKPRCCMCIDNRDLMVMGVKGIVRLSRYLIACE